MIRDVVQHSAGPPVCRFCEQKFALNTLLFSHTKLVHGQTGVKKLVKDGIFLIDDYEFLEFKSSSSGHVSDILKENSYLNGEDKCPEHETEVCYDCLIIMSFYVHHFDNFALH